MEYRLKLEAKEHLRHIYHYGFHLFGQVVADHYYESLFERFERIAENPYLYPPVDFIKAGYRRSVFGADTIYYRIIDGIVEIIAILGSQDTQTSL